MAEKFSQEKLDTRSTPYTMVWFSQPVRGLFPITRDITGQDEMIVSAWHTPGKELKIETNLPEVQSMKVTSAGPTKKFEFNGKRWPLLTSTPPPRRPGLAQDDPCCL